MMTDHKNDTGQMDYIDIPFGQVPKEATTDKTISEGARLLLCHFFVYRNRFDGKAWPGQQRLADELGVSRMTISKRLKELKIRGWITIKRRGLKKTNMYKIYTSPKGDVNEGLHQDVTPPLHKHTSEQNNLKEGGTPPPSPSPSSKNQKNQLRKALELHFIEVTKLFPPKMNTAKQKRAAGTKWWGPLRDIAELVEWNESDGKILISQTISRLNGLTISDPNSILNTANAVWSEKQRQAPSKESHPLWKFGDPYPGQ